jgi:hypothetical protein
LNALGKSGDQWNKPTAKGGKGSPIDAVAVVVYTVILVQLMNIEFALLDQIEV